MLVYSTGLYAFEVEETDNGIYKQKASSWLYYIVDTVTEVCLSAVAGGGATQISCESLTKREEWKSVITWVEHEEFNRVAKGF